MVTSRGSRKLEDPEIYYKKNYPESNLLLIKYLIKIKYFLSYPCLVYTPIHGKIDEMLFYNLQTLGLMNAWFSHLMMEMNAFSLIERHMFSP